MNLSGIYLDDHFYGHTLTGVGQGKYIFSRSGKNFLEI
jgi:hypothetical protein